MKSASLSDIKKELMSLSPLQQADLLLRMAKFKKENKDFLSYLLFLSHDKDDYINLVKQQMEQQFEEINTYNGYYLKKALRKILKYTARQIKFANDKHCEAELLIYFCQSMRKFDSYLKSSSYLMNMYEQQIKKINKALLSLHEDYQFDYKNQLEQLIIQ